MKQNRTTLLLLVGIFALMIGLLVMQSAQNQTIAPTPINEILSENEIQLGNGLLFPDISAEEIVLINILDPVLDSQVTVARTNNGDWRAVSDDTRQTDQDYANSLAITLENIPYTVRIGSSEDGNFSNYGLNEHDALIVVTAVLENESWYTFLVGNPVSTDNTNRGFYTVVGDSEEIFIVPPEPILYLVQYLEAFEDTQKLDN